MAGSRDNKAPPKNLSRTFDVTTPKAYLRAAKNPAAFAILSGIEQRGEALKDRAQDLYRKFEDRWISKEAMRLWARHNAQSASHPAPTGTRRDVTPEALMKIASRNVQARTNARLSKINQIKTRMSNTVVRNLEAVSLKRSFDTAAPADGPKKSRKREITP